MVLRAGDEDTICALSTPPGTGGIAVVRVSGPKAFAITRRLCGFLPDKPESHRIYYGLLRSLVGDETLDEVLVSCFADGRSFTGEETTEVSCHGGEVLVANVLKELLTAGCRLAERGEFTYRAFMNGRLDLVQAESVLGLIESQSKQSAKVALRQLQGHLSTDFACIEDDLLWLLAHLEASIDFSTEGIEVLPSEHLLARTSALSATVAKLIASYNQGKLLRDGIEIALVGRPNVGKSSLLNSLLGEDRAIVTPHAGTTRDTVEGRLSISGVPVTFVDTAGLRETDNEIEKIGIERSRSAMGRADFVFHVIDASVAEWREDVSELVLEPNGYVVVNKMDLAGSESNRTEIVEALESVPEIRVFWVSAKTRDGISKIEAMVGALTRSVDSETSNVVTQARHLELLQKIHSCLGSALGLIKEDSSPEFIAFELQEAIRAIHELLGKEFDEQVIDRIFKEFCLGK